MDSQIEITNNQILLQILDRLEKIEEKLNEIEKSTKKMDNHVTFVDSVYERVKEPFHGLMRFSNYYITGHTSKPLEIEHKL